MSKRTSYVARDSVEGDETDLSIIRNQTGSNSVETPEFRETLRVRAAVVLTLGVTIWGTILTLGMTGVDSMYSREVIGVRCLRFMMLTVAVWSVAAAALWTRKGWTTYTLRVFEYGTLVPHAGMLIMARVLQFMATEVGVVHGTDFLLAARSHNGFGWLAALVIWGIVYPHTRLAMLVLNSALVACPILTDLCLILFEPTRLPPLILPAIITAEMLLLGFVVSLFGLHRISTLQAEVVVARSQIEQAKELGPYTLKWRLGVGAMGEVYLAEHRLLKRPCAVKLIRPDRVGDPLVLARFEREAQATARLKHPNTVDVFDFGRTEDGAFYYVMEFLDGVSLEDVVRRHGPLSSGRVVHILRQLCGALREAHRAGLIHRDIKPSNVLLCRHGGMFDVVKLVDFGLVRYGEMAAESSSMTQSGSVIGTPDYISPEQADGTGTDQRSDLYSLGGTAYFLLTGQTPFTGKTVLDILFAHRHQAVAPIATKIASASRDLEAVILRLLAKNPSDRYQTAETVEASLRCCSDIDAWSDLDSERWWSSFAPPADSDTTGLQSGGDLRDQLPVPGSTSSDLGNSPHSKTLIFPSTITPNADGRK